jgi:serine/threonine protein phosphatase PrpC
VFRAFGATEKGPVRPVNEDCFAVHPDLGLCVLADGMGGHNAGEVAARMVVEGVVEHVRRATAAPPSVCGELPASLVPFGTDPNLSADANLLRNAILLANAEILETSIRSRRFAGMGTTVVAARVNGGRLSAAYAGDSRLYQLNGAGLRRLTTDDSWLAAVLAQEPDADPERYQNHPMRHALTNVVGGRAPTEVHVLDQPLDGRGWLLATTDGVHGVLDDAALERLMRGDDPQRIARGILRAALKAGSKDNCTVIVAAY